MSNDQALPQLPSSPADARHASEPVSGLSRRSFLGSGVGAAALVAGGVTLPALVGSNPAAAFPPQDSAARKSNAFRKRVNAAVAHLNTPNPLHLDNGDEQLYADKRGNYTKGMPHDAFGRVDLSAYSMFTVACDNGSYSDFDLVPSGEGVPAQRRRFVNPLCGMAFDLEGGDSQEFAIPPAPAFSSAERAGEIVENYWMALLRDIPFNDYATNPLVAQACADLTSMSDFRGPKIAGAVTPQTLFRETAPGALVGPWTSQFFWKSQPYGAQFIEPRMRTIVPGTDFMTTEASWLAIQNGTVPVAGLSFDPTLRYIRNGRDISEWVHIDVLFQAYFQALLHMKVPPDPANPFTGGGLGVAFNPGNPYLTSVMQDGFGTFGGPHCATLLAEVSTRALKAVWFQKWYVHRNLRPEAYAGAVHHTLVNGLPYSHHADVLNSAALAQVFSQNGTYLLPMAFPEGSPLHPSYGSGHATVAGACVTILKALFDTQVPFPNPVVASSDGLTLSPYTAPDASQMTVEGELNKLAINVAVGRNIAGVHWRSDALQSLLLGEAVALSILRDQKITYREPFGGYTLRKFDGTVVTV